VRLEDWLTGRRSSFGAVVCAACCRKSNIRRERCERGSRSMMNRLQWAVFVVIVLCLALVGRWSVARPPGPSLSRPTPTQRLDASVSSARVLPTQSHPPPPPPPPPPLPPPPAGPSCGSLSRALSPLGPPAQGNVEPSLQLPEPPPCPAAEQRPGLESKLPASEHVVLGATCCSPRPLFHFIL
jgi:hypothetical protein